MNAVLPSGNFSSAIFIFPWHLLQVISIGGSPTPFYARL
jgi:hypothetical protein